MAILAHSDGPAVLVHGGAGTIVEARRAAHQEGCQAAAELAWEVLTAGGSALDAVERAIRELESRPCFNAGRGSALHRDGDIEMDASIMEGAGLRAGAVGVVRELPHPISLARALLEAGVHVMLAGPAAEAFADARGIERCASADLETPHMRAAWEKHRGRIMSTTGGTVGAVARDAAGHLAAGTSTGGTQGKWAGRIGDSPIIGSGTYADDQLGAVSATGDGESIMRVVLAHRVLLGTSASADAEAHARNTLDAMSARCGGQAGLIAILPDGRLLTAHNTPAMSRGWRCAGMPAAVAGLEG